MEKLKQDIFNVLETERHENVFGMLIKYMIVTLILGNILAVILETVESIHLKYHFYFDMLEVFSVFVFTVEYILRVWVCTDRPEYSGKYGRLKYIFSIMAIIDLLAILPFYLVIFTPLDLRYIMTLRFARMLRIFKLKRYSHAMQTLGEVVVEKKEELVITFFSIIILLIMASSLMFLIEHEAQPEAFSSIPATMWWGVATLTTVGYGDMIPITPMGKMLGALIAILGLAMFALPAGLLSSGFTEQIQMQRKRNKNLTCPHCHKEIRFHEKDLHQSPDHSDDHS